ncbi:uncharacterized protein LOC117576040 [Drosophila albomicans]|uniref:Uncharacterized protein LOC117576040 n=1 Tax=Drosophila albomicans TaxID=7291 RepID=A0A6P8XIW1_DROAB|nr:uncharacterized protein LOC117576040 [Drosophila albomicans]
MADSTKDSTPLPRRRLGLRLHKGARTTPGNRFHAPQVATTPLSADNTNNSETPRASQPAKLKANSTNCRRLGLTRRRPDLSKKRLEFIVTQDSAAVVEEQTSPQKLEWRQRKILELEADIETWKNGFNAAINDLQALVPNPVTMEKLLTELKLPLELLQYLEED